MSNAPQRLPSKQKRQKEDESEKDNMTNDAISKLESMAAKGKVSRRSENKNKVPTKADSLTETQVCISDIFINI